MSRDFLTNRTRTKAIIGSGNGAGSVPTPKLVIYGDNSASDNSGGLESSFSTVLESTSTVGNDVFLYISGAIDGKENNTANSVSVFGGDLVVSGTLYAEKQIIEVEGVATGSLTIDGGIIASGSITATDLILTSGNINIQNGSVNIGDAEDDNYTDGLFTDFTPSTLIGTAVDRFNEVLKALAPAPAPSLDSFDVDTSNGISGKLSFGSANDQSSASPAYISVDTSAGYVSDPVKDVNIEYGPESASGENFRLGIFNGTQVISGTLNDDVNDDTYTNNIVNYPDFAFGSADQGSLKLFLNGSEIHSTNIAPFTDSTCDYNNDPTITMDSTSLLRIGMQVTGTGIPSGATISSITNSTTFELSASTTGGSVTNGTLTFVFASGNDLNSNSSGFTSLSSATPGKFASDTNFNNFKYRTGGWQVGTADQVNGRNYVQVKHVIGVSETVTGFAEWVNDNNSDALTISSNITTFTGTGSKHLSGIEYFTGGSSRYAANVNNVYKYIYSSSPITFSVSSSPSNLLTLSNQTIPAIGGSEDHTKILSLDTNNVNLSLPSSNRVLGGSITVGCTVPHPLKTNLTGSGTESTASQILIDNVSASSINLSEYFTDENYRLVSGTYANQSDVTSSSNAWVSTTEIITTNSGYSDALMTYDDKIVSTKYSGLVNSGNFSTLVNGPSGNPDYSNGNIAAGQKYYYRKIQNESGSAIRDLSYTIKGDASLKSHGTTLGSSNNNFKLYFKFPGTTQWLDAASLYAFHDVSSDGDGCAATTPSTNISSSEITNTVTFGTESVPDDEYIVLRALANKTWSGNLDKIVFSLGLTNTNAVNASPALSQIDGTTGVSGKLSFGSTLTKSGYTNVGSLVNSTTNANSLFNVSGTRLGIFNKTQNITGTLNNQISASGNSYLADSWGNGKANLGTIKLEVNGSVIDTRDLTTLGSLNSVNFNYSAAVPGKNVNNIPDHRYYYRTGTFNVPYTSQIDGWNYAKVIHNDGTTDHTTNYVEWVNSVSNQISFSNEAVSNFTQGSTSPNYLSGIQYFVDAKADFTATASNVYKYVYSNESNAVTFPTNTNCSINSIQVNGSGVVNGTVSSVSRSLPDLDVNVSSAAEENISITGNFSFNNFTKSLPGNLQNATLKCNVKHPISGNTADSSTISSSSPLMYTVSNSSTELLEDFSSESYRLKSDTYANQSDVSSINWDSSQSLVGNGSGGNAGHNDGLQVFDDKLIVPDTNFNNTSSMVGPQNNPDYSSASGTRTFFRRFRNTTTSSKFGFDLSIRGNGTSIVNNTVSLGSGNIKVFLKVPNTSNSQSTGFMDLALPFSTGQTSNNSGCHQGTFTSSVSSNGNGTTNTVTFGTTYVSANDYIVLKIEADSSWNGNLNRIEVDWS